MKIAIVGGGLTGLSAAYYLSKKGHQITVFEKDSQLGGLAAGVKVDSVFIDKYYHHIFAGDRLILDLIKEVGLGDRLVFKKPQTAIFYQGRTYPFTSALDLLRFKPLDFFSRLRFGIVGLYLKAVPDGRKYSTVAAQGWLRKFYGRQVYEVIWEPLLRSKFGEDAGDISMAWFWSRVHDRSFSLGYLRGGFQVLIDKLAEKIKENGGEINLGCEVIDFDHLNNRTEFDAAIFTAPVKSEKIEWLGALSLILVPKEKFLADGTYWLNINDGSFPFVAVVEHTNFISPADYGGHHILYLGGYYHQNHRFFKMKREEIFQEFLPYLQKINPVCDPSFFILHSLFTDPYAQPIVTTDYAANIPSFETPIKNVYLATMAQVYPQDRGMNQAVRLGKDVAEIVAA